MIKYADQTMEREFNGDKVKLVIKGNKFLVKGKSLASLSAAARSVTGYRIAGERFFGKPKAAAIRKAAKLAKAARR